MIFVCLCLCARKIERQNRREGGGEGGQDEGNVEKKKRVNRKRNEFVWVTFDEPVTAIRADDIM